jgi:hypothetical protein
MAVIIFNLKDRGQVIYFLSVRIPEVEIFFSSTGDTEIILIIHLAPYFQIWTQSGIFQTLILLRGYAGRTLSGFLIPKSVSKIEFSQRMFNHSPEIEATWNFFHGLQVKTLP